MATDNQNFVSQTPDLNLWLRFALDNFAASINCVSIGTINSFDAATQTATVAISYLKVIKGANPNLPNPAPNDQTSDVYLKYPLIIKCPVVVLQGGGGYLTFPIVAGDAGLVFFNDREIDTWLTTGQTTYPHNLRTHDLSDAIILLGIRNLTNPIQNYNTKIPSLTDSTGERLTQSGMMSAYGGSTAPSGWLLCNGSSYLRTTYPLLFAVIGTTYGSVDGTHFNVPNMAGQIPVGIGGTLGLTLGQEFGEVTHLLTGPESGIQAHSHVIDANNIGSGGTLGNGNWTPAPYSNTEVTGPTDAQTTHNNVQPSLGVNWIIKI